MIGAMAIRPARWSEVAARIATVPQYAEPGNVTIQQERIRPEQLCPLCRLVRVYRLAAIQDLVMAFKKAGLPWDEYVARYWTEIRPEAIEALRRRARTETITLLCGCEDESHCHRGLLKAKLATLKRTR